MLNYGRFGRVVLLALLGMPLAVDTRAQGRTDRFPLTQLNATFCAKGRLQDCDWGDPVMREVLSRGKDAIPILISQLTDSARSKQQVFQFWNATSSGDIAYIILIDLFTDSDWKTFNMPGVPDWRTINKGCDMGAETCWREYLRHHGRESIQRAWLQAWSQHKDQVLLDSKSLCFRIVKE